MWRCWRSGEGDTGTRRHGDAATRGRGDTGTRGHGDTGTRGHGDTGTRRHGDTATRGRGDAATRRHGDTETRRHGDTATRRHGDTGTRRCGDTGGQSGRLTIGRRLPTCPTIAGGLPHMRGGGEWVGFLWGWIWDRATILRRLRWWSAWRWRGSSIGRRSRGRKSSRSSCGIWSGYRWARPIRRLWSGWRAWYGRRA